MRRNENKSPRPCGRYVVPSEFSTGDPSNQNVNHGGDVNRDAVICKRPGCGRPVPVKKGRGRSRQFCSNECARRYHNDARTPSPRTPKPDAEEPLAALDSLIRRAAVLVREALDQTASADRSVVLARLAEAEAARLRAEELASTATAQAIEAQRQIEVLTEELAATREEARAARAVLKRAGGQALQAQVARSRSRRPRVPGWHRQ